MSSASRQVQAGSRRSAPRRRPAAAPPAPPDRRPPGPPRGSRRALLLDRRDAWIVLPLRAFLGVTFIYAGLQKLADRWFFSAAAPSSIQSQLHHAARTSPLGGLVGGLAHHAVIVGLTIAFAELAVGIGALLGLWTRAAGAAGMVLSVGFLLTVSWHSRPFYYGADIVFLFAWTPLLLGGAGPLSIDAVARADVRDRLGLPSDPAVIIGFDAVRQMCGSYADGRCRARRDHRCAPDGCPVLATAAPPAAVLGEVDRRAFMQKAGIAGWIGAAAVVGGGIVALVGRVAPVKASKNTPTLAAGSTGSTASAPAASTPSGPATSAPDTTVTDPGASTSAPPDTSASAATTPSGSTPPNAAVSPPASAAPPATAAAPTTQAPPAPPGLTALGPATAVPVGGAASFTDPATGDPAFVVQPTAGRFVAFDASCTHQGCPVQYAGSKFQCPCHGAQFDSTTGEVLQGPAGTPLRKIGITLSGGTLYAK